MKTRVVTNNLLDFFYEMLTDVSISVKHVFVMPVKLKLDSIRPRDEVYMLGSRKINGKLSSKKALMLGFVIKSRSTCKYWNPSNNSLSPEDLSLVNILVHKIDNSDFKFDFKNNVWSDETKAALAKK